MEEGVASIKAEVMDGVNKVQADVSESVNNGIEQVMIHSMTGRNQHTLSR